MINGRFIMGIWNKCLRNKPMNVFSMYTGICKSGDTIFGFVTLAAKRPPGFMSTGIINVNGAIFPYQDIESWM